MDNHANKKIITFPKGIPGFEKHKKFIMNEEVGNPIIQIESIEDKDVGFVLLPPQLYFADYLSQVEFGSEEVDSLDITKDDTVEVWAIITLCLSDITKSTVNLRAPIVINPRTNQGFQFILNDDDFSSRQKLFAYEQEADERQSNQEGAVG